MCKSIDQLHIFAYKLKENVVDTEEPVKVQKVQKVQKVFCTKKNS